MSVSVESGDGAPHVDEHGAALDPLQTSAAARPLADEAAMAPEASPWRTQKFNRRPIIAFGIVAVALCSLMGYAALQRYAESNADNNAPRPSSSDDPLLPRGADSRRMANDIIGTPRVGLIPDAAEPVQKPPAAEADAQRVPIVSVVDEEPPQPPRGASADGPLARTAEEADEWIKARKAALREALVAQRTIRFDRRAQEPPQGDFVQRELARVAAQRAAVEGPSDPAAAYQQMAAQASQIVAAQTSSAAPAPGGALFPDGAPPGTVGAPSGSRNDLRVFGKSGSQSRWQLPSQLEDPPSPYMVQVGSVIGAVLDSAVNSDLPGPLIAHVSQAVYSSTGRRELLIPQGTAIFGEYSSDVVFGQDRLLVAWQRLRFPTGQTLDIGAMPGTDGVGRSGFADQVDHHYVRLFGSALLLSLVTTGVTQTQVPSKSGSDDRMSVGAAMSQALGLQFGQVTSQLLQKNMNIAPTIEIRNGFRFNIVVTKDLVFPGPYPAR